MGLDAACRRVSPCRMDRLTAFGFVAVTLMLIFYALEDRSPWFILAFSGACALGSIYGFLQGAWPFGVVEAIWACVGVALADEDAIGLGLNHRLTLASSIYEVRDHAAPPRHCVLDRSDCS
jgi:hypothetical protein